MHSKFNGSKSMIIFLIITSLFILSIAPAVAQNSHSKKEKADIVPEKHVIEDVPYFPMYDYWSTCAMTSLEMASSYYGFDYSIMTLMNLGWQYGATFVENQNGPVIMPGAEQPVTGILHAAETLGFSVEEINNQEKEEAWNTLTSFLAEDKPVIIQWTLHTVLAVGYDETGKENEIIFHNPASPAALLDSYMGLNKSKLKSNIGEFSRMKKSKWFGEKYWQNANSYPPKKYEMIAIKPPNKREEIDLKGVLRRNAYKTLGKRNWTSQPPYVWYSVDAFEEAAKNIESGDWSKEDLKSLFRAGDWGPASRSHASAFLIGLYQKTGIKELREAGQKFEKSGYLWQEANQIWEYVESKGQEFENGKYQSIIAKAFRKISNTERWPEKLC